MLQQNSLVSHYFTDGTAAQVSMDTFLSWTVDIPGSPGNYLTCVDGEWAWGTAYATESSDVEAWLTANQLSIIDPVLLNSEGVIPTNNQNVYLSPGEFLQLVVRMHLDYSYTESTVDDDESTSVVVNLPVTCSIPVVPSVPRPEWPAPDQPLDERLMWMPSRSRLYDFDTIGQHWIKHRSENASLQAIDDTFISALKQAYLQNGLNENVVAIWLPCWKGPTATVMNSGVTIKLLAVKYADGTIDYVTWTCDRSAVAGNFVFAISTNDYVHNYCVDVWYRDNGLSTSFTYITSISISEYASPAQFPSEIPVAWAIVDWNDSTIQDPLGNNTNSVVFLANMELDNDYFGYNFVSPVGNNIIYAVLPMYYDVDYFNLVTDPYCVDQHMLNTPEYGYINAIHRRPGTANTFDDVSGQYTTHWDRYNQLVSRPRLTGYERNTPVTAYRTFKPIVVDDHAITKTVLKAGTVTSASITVSLSWDYLVSEFANGYCPRIRYILTIQDEIIDNIITETVESIDFGDAVRAALSLVDVFNADEVLDSDITEELKNLINSKYNMLDPYMQMYADMTSNYVVSEILNALMDSIVSNDVMVPTYGVDDNTLIQFTNVYAYTPAQLRDLNDPVILKEVTESLAGFSAQLDYRIELFNRVHEAFLSSGDVKVKETLDKIASDIRGIYDTIIASMTAVNKPSKALLLNAAYQETVLGKVSDVIQAAAAAGAETISDAIQWVSRALAGSDSAYTLPDKDKILYQSILSQSVYAGYEANILKDTLEYNSDVDYWSSYFTRKGAAVALPSGVEPEFRTASDGAQYLWPPVVSSVVKSSSFDRYIDDGGYFYVPFNSSYVIFKRITGNVYEIDWCARFNGGTDEDLINAFNNCIEEFSDVSHDLAAAYLGTDDFDFVALHVLHGVQTEIPGGFEIATLIGSLSSVGLNTLSGFLATGSPYGAALAGGVTTIATVAQTALADENAIRNVNFSATALINANEDILNSVEFANAGVLTSRGLNAVNMANALLLWAIKYGFVAPVKAYTVSDVTPVGHGVYAPTLIPPKYYYVGESQDYSGWMISLGIVVTAYALHWRRNTQAVRMRAFLPGTLASAISAAAGWLYSGLSNTIDKVMSLQQANLLGWETETDEDGNPITLGYLANMLQSITGDVGSIASIASAIQGTVNTTGENVETILRRGCGKNPPITRY